MTTETKTHEHDNWYYGSYMPEDSCRHAIGTPCDCPDFPYRTCRDCELYAELAVVERAGTDSEVVAWAAHDVKDW